MNVLTEFRVTGVSSALCCGSKYIEFGSESRILAQFGSGSGSGSRKLLNTDPIRIWIRIQEAPEYGSNTDLDPQHWHVPTVESDV